MLCSNMLETIARKISICTANKPNRRRGVAIERFRLDWKQVVFEITCSGDTSLCLQLVHRTHHLSVDFNRHKFGFLVA